MSFALSVAAVTGNAMPESVADDAVDDAMVELDYTADNLVKWYTGMKGDENTLVFHAA